METKKTSKKTTKLTAPTPAPTTVLAVGERTEPLKPRPPGILKNVGAPVVKITRAESPIVPPAATALIIALLFLVTNALAAPGIISQPGTQASVFTNRLLTTLSGSGTTNRLTYTNDSAAFGPTNAIHIRTNATTARWEWHTDFATRVATNTANRPTGTWLTVSGSPTTYGYTRYEPRSPQTIADAPASSAPNPSFALVQGDGSITNNTTGSALSIIYSNTITRWVDATNGNDSNPGTQSLPWKTLGYAASNATSGITIQLMPGVYNVSTNTVRLAHGVHLRGPATILSAADLTVNGVALNPGSQSVVENVIIQCDTNTIYAKFLAAEHSGFFGGFGVSLSNPSANNKSFTNAIARNLQIKDATTDGFYFRSETGKPSSLTVIDAHSVAYSDSFAGEYNDAAGQHTNTTVTLINCRLDAQYNAMLDDITFGSGSVAQFARGKFYLINCYGNGVGLANGANGQISATDGATVQVVGGMYSSDTTMFYVGAGSMSGYATVNGTNTLISPLLGSGNLLTAVRPNIGSNSVAVSGNISIYLTNQDGTVYRVAAQRIVP